MIPCIVGSILQSSKREHLFILSFCFLFLFLDAYFILFYAVSLSFLFIVFALGGRLVCLLVELAMQPAKLFLLNSILFIQIIGLYSVIKQGTIRDR
jgi:hypothetical protein